MAAGPAGPPQPPDAPRAAAWTVDDELEALEREIPGFAGWHYEPGPPGADGSTGDPREPVLVIRSTRPGAVRRPVLSHLVPERVPVEVRPAEYRFSELRRFKGAAGRALAGLPGLVGIDADEVRNRLVVYVAPGTDPAAIRAAAAQTIPPGALLVEHREPLKPVVSLQDQSSDRRGGFQIEMPIGTGRFTCTLGVIGDYDGSQSPPSGYGDRALLTVSHCSETMGQVDGDVYRQADVPGGTLIGLEWIDPAFSGSLPGCPSGYTCRWSDSLLAAYEPGVAGDDKRIARTQLAGSSFGSLTIDSTRPEWIVTQEGGSVTVGQTLQKMGRTSGWTTGEVTATCVDTGFSTSEWFLCQHYVEAGVFNGDSGSPVFETLPPTTGAILHGIVSARSGDEYVFSPFSGIEADLGPLDVTETMAPHATFSHSHYGTPYLFFDASDSFDPDGGSLTYAWSFGDGHTYSGSSPTVSHYYSTSSGSTVTVYLTVTDGESQTGFTYRSVYVP